MYRGSPVNAAITDIKNRMPYVETSTKPLYDKMETRQSPEER